MPPIPADQMSPEQRAAVAEITSGPRGALIGPFIPALRSPEFMRRLQRLGEYLRYDNAIGHKLTEMTILLTAAAWRQDFEWSVHAPLARRAGLSEESIAAIAAGRRPPRLSDDEAIVHDLFEELQRTKTVGDGTYARAVRAFGERAVIDLIGAIGYYSTLAMIMNAACTPAPPGPWAGQEAQGRKPPGP